MRRSGGKAVGILGCTGCLAQAAWVTFLAVVIIHFVRKFW